jgi:hypothetical protein
MNRKLYSSSPPLPERGQKNNYQADENFNDIEINSLTSEDNSIEPFVSFKRTENNTVPSSPPRPNRKHGLFVHAYLIFFKIVHVSYSSTS